MPIKDKDKRKRYTKGYWKRYYSIPKNKEKHLAAVRANNSKRKREINQWASDYKLNKGCKICGFKEHPEALDFAHRSRKTKLGTISILINRKSWSLKRVQKEANKCDILCANHHRIATALENKKLR